jgi:hypothetical protein
MTFVCHDSEPVCCMQLYVGEEGAREKYCFVCLPTVSDVQVPDHD